MSTLYLVRHGQSTWNAAGRLQGQAPGVALTALGREQARAAAHRLPTTVDAICSSDLLRATQSAEPIAERLGLPVVTCPGLRERDYGSLEGLSSAAAMDAAGSVDWTDPDVRPGGAESLRAIHARVATTLTRLVADHPDGSLVLVTHGDTIRVVAAWAAGLGPHEIPWRDVPNGSITVLQAVPAPAADAG